MASFRIAQPAARKPAGFFLAAILWAIAGVAHAGALSLAGGKDHAMVVRSDGTLWARGYNGNGKLGDGTSTGRPSPIQVGSGYRAVSAGHFHTVAIKQDGSLWAWGNNSSGQLGDGTTSQRLSPVLIGTGFKAVAAGGYHTVAVGTDGTLWAWGSNYHGQVGDSSPLYTLADRTSPVQIGSGFESVAAGQNHSVALKSDGSLWAWGANSYWQLGTTTPAGSSTPIQVATGVAMVSAGVDVTAMVKTDSSLWTWGDTPAGTPAQLGTGFRTVTTGGYHYAAVQTDGSLWTWGSGGYGQFGDGTTGSRASPVRVGEGYEAVAAGMFHSLATRTDGSVVAWGFNDGGALSHNAVFTRLNPVKISAFGADSGSAYPVDCVFAWAEWNYSQYLAPAGASSRSQSPYYYRQYPGTGAYIGTASSRVYYLGPASGNALLDLGSLSSWMTIGDCL
jgi:alpha-tubulin suppressor-like RCC1 family protein